MKIAFSTRKYLKLSLVFSLMLASCVNTKDAENVKFDLTQLRKNIIHSASSKDLKIEMVAPRSKRIRVDKDFQKSLIKTFIKATKNKPFKKDKDYKALMDIVFIVKDRDKTEIFAIYHGQFLMHLDTGYFWKFKDAKAILINYDRWHYDDPIL